MADRKITGLNEQTEQRPEQLLHVITDPVDNPANRKMTVENFFSPVRTTVEVANNVVVSGWLSGSRKTALPADAVTVPEGSIFHFYDGTDDWLYVKVDGGTTYKRVLLASV